MKKFLLATTLLTAGLSSNPALAAPILDSFTPTDTSVGGGFFVGYQFTATQNLSITDLGFYDAGLDGLASSHDIGIFSLGGALLGSVTVGPGSANLVGDFRYASLASALNLISGTSYQIGGTTSGSDAWVFQGNSLVTNGISYDQSRFRQGGSFGALDTPADDREYFTVNALFGDVAGAVPEPSTWAFMIFGFGAIGGAMRRRRKANVEVSCA